MKEVFEIFYVNDEIYESLISNPHEGITLLGENTIRVREIWKNIIGFEDLYQISNLGRVKSLPRNTTKGRILIPSKKKTGYLTVGLCKNGLMKHPTIHRCMALAFIPNPGNLPQVNHKDGIKTNNYVWNFEWSSRSHNIREAMRLGLKPSKQGENVHCSKLTAVDVKIIREAIKQQVPGITLSKYFGVSKSRISSIKTGKNWKSVL